MSKRCVPRTAYCVQRTACCARTNPQVGCGRRRTHYAVRGTRSRGSVLLYVVWVMVLLSCFAAGVSSQAFMALGVADRLMGTVQAVTVARSAIQLAASLVAQDPTQTVDGFTDLWADNPGTWTNHRLGGGSFDLLAASRPDGSLRYGLSDEGQRLHLNTAPEEALARLAVTVAAMPEEDANALAAAIGDWRDEDDRQRPLGAEGFYYRSLRDGYDCKDGPFEQMEELLLVRGVSAERYRALEPYLTVYGSGPVNLNTAPRAVLSALGVSEIGVSGLLFYRVGEDGQEQTNDDRVLSSLGVFEAEVGPLLPAEDVARVAQLAAAGVVSTGSDAFRMTIQARSEQPPSSIQVTAVISRKGELLLWSEQ